MFDIDTQLTVKIEFSSRNDGTFFISISGKTKGQNYLSTLPILTKAIRHAYGIMLKLTPFREITAHIFNFRHGMTEINQAVEKKNFSHFPLHDAPHTYFSEN